MGRRHLLAPVASLRVSCLSPLSPGSEFSHLLPRLKTISLVIRSTQGAEEVLKAHEEQLKEAQAVPATLQELEATKASLKVPFGGLGFTGDRVSRSLC